MENNMFQVKTMLLLIFIGLFSLAAAQFGISCNSGVTTFCQTTYSSGSPRSVFNLRNNQQYSYAQLYISVQQYCSRTQSCLFFRSFIEEECFKFNRLLSSNTYHTFHSKGRKETMCWLFYIHLAQWVFPYYRVKQTLKLIIHKKTTKHEAVQYNV